MEWGILGELGLALIIVGVGVLALPKWRSWRQKMKWLIGGGAGACLLVVGLVFLAMPVWRYQYAIEKPYQRIDRLTGAVECNRVIEPPFKTREAHARELLLDVQYGDTRFENLSVKDKELFWAWIVYYGSPKMRKGYPTVIEWERNHENPFAPKPGEVTEARETWLSCR
jgi:hypothetical protein